MNVCRLFETVTLRQPGDKALEDAYGAYTFGQLWQEVKSQAGLYAGHGVGAGDKVLVLVPFSRELYVHIIALFYLGGTTVFFDAKPSLGIARKMLKHIGCKRVVVQKKHFWAARLLSPLFGLKRVFAAGEPRSGKDETAMYPCQGGETALITFTTGSTGFPKPAKRTHAFLREQLRALTPYLDGAPGETGICSFPVVILGNLGLGLNSIIPAFNPARPREIQWDRIVRQMKESDPISIAGSPFFVKNLGERLEKKEAGKILKVLTGGGPVSPAEARDLAGLFPGADVTVLYGSTEAEPIASVSGKDLAAQENWAVEGLLAGEIHPSCRVKILNWAPDGLGNNISREEVAGGEWGEIAVSGPQVLREYYGEGPWFDQNKYWEGGELWHRTGDAGRKDPGERIFLLGRCGQMVKREKKWISPFVFWAFCAETEGVKRGAALLNKGELWAVIETCDGVDKKLVANRIREGSPYAFDHIVFARIPMDTRHHSRIDTVKLKRKLELAIPG